MKNYVTLYSAVPYIFGVVGNSCLHHLVRSLVHVACSLWKKQLVPASGPCHTPPGLPPIVDPNLISGLWQVLPLLLTLLHLVYCPIVPFWWHQLLIHELKSTGGGGGGGGVGGGINGGGGAGASRFWGP